jgi:hypothetical protein
VSAGDVRDRTWVTRTGVHIDRMASAWLIRRFIDPDAKFKFVRGQEYAPEKGELRFDMFEADFTHEGRYVRGAVAPLAPGPGLGRSGRSSTTSTRRTPGSRPETWA